jgi:Tfp pilus assembly protein PilN
MASIVQEKPTQDEPVFETVAPGVLLLPSHLFFVRTLDLPAGIRPEEIPSFVEVSLEEISPFTLPQLYYGYYLPVGGARLVLFAAFRRKLDIYVGEEWEDAELVVPDLVSVLGMAPSGPKLVFLQDELEVTAIYWASGGAVPDRVVSRMVPEAIGENPREKVRAELRERIGGIPEGIETILLEGEPKARFRDRILLFELVRAGEAKSLSVEIPRQQVWPMDVRDKDFLEASRKEKRQNRWLWQAGLLLLAGFLALAVFEGALFAGTKIIRSRQAQSDALKPEVARIEEEQALALRLEELEQNRLQPFEMLAYLNRLRPPSVYFTRVATTGVRSVEAEAVTPKQADVDRFERALKAAEGTKSVEIKNLRVRDGESSFTVALTVTPEAMEKMKIPAPATEPVGGLVLPPTRQSRRETAEESIEETEKNEVSTVDDVPTLPAEENPTR